MTITPEAVADRFAEILRGWLTANQWKEMQRRNAAETKQDICHSHDFCDANVAMDQALRDLGVVIADALTDEQTQLWNAAWNNAFVRYLGGKPRGVVMRFTDGVTVDTRGPLRRLELADGLYVVGEGMLIPCENEAEVQLYLKKGE